MRYLHTMVRISDVDESLKFYCDILGLKEVHRYDSEKGRFTNIFLYAPGDEATAASDKRAPVIELTYIGTRKNTLLDGLGPTGAW